MKNNSEQLDLLLIGHTVEDWIFEDGKEPHQQWGGVYNCSRSFLKVATGYWGYPPPKIGVEPSAYGHAFIKINRQNAAKDVSASLNDRFREPSFRKAKWNHYCYLNEISPLLMPENQVGIYSADLCKGKGLKNAQYFDYIFLSKDEHDPCSESYECGSDRPTFIAHSPERVEIWKNGKKLWESKPIERIEDCNVLGVGDHFAMAFVVDKLYNNEEDEDAVNFAIARCREYLLYN